MTGHSKFPKFRRPRRLFLTDYTVVSRGYQTDCWEWKGKLNGGGYGRLNLKGKWLQAHRVVYESIKGKIPAGLQLDHLCRNTACVNPDHLEPTTNTVNTRRSRKTLLTEEQVIACLTDRRPARYPAAEFGVHECTVRNVRTGSRWKDVRDEYVRIHGEIAPWPATKRWRQLLAVAVAPDVERGTP